MDWRNKNEKLNPSERYLTHKSWREQEALYKIIKGEVLIFILKKNTVIPLGKN